MHELHDHNERMEDENEEVELPHFLGRLGQTQELSITGHSKDVGGECSNDDFGR